MLHAQVFEPLPDSGLQAGDVSVLRSVLFCDFMTQVRALASRASVGERPQRRPRPVPGSPPAQPRAAQGCALSLSRAPAHVQTLSMQGADNQKYEEVSELKRLLSVIEEYMVDYNAQNKNRIDLVLFL